MKPEHVLLSTWSIPMEVLDVALYSNILYVLQSDQLLHLLPYHEPDLSLQAIYADPYPTQFLKEVGKQSIGAPRRTVSFEKPIRDFVVYRHTFFYLDEDGMYSWGLEQGNDQPTLLVAGSFRSMRMNTTNHLFLASEEGVFEYRFEANGAAMLTRLESSPTYAIQVDRNQVVQIDENRKPFQRLDLVTNHHQVFVERVIPVQNMTAENTINEPLELDDATESFHPMPLFDFLPHQKKQLNHSGTDSTPIAIRPLPSAALGGVLLGEDTVHVTTAEDALHLFAGRTPYYKIPIDETCRVRLYPKSRKFQHHLHLVHPDRIDFYLFTRIG